MKTFSRAQPVVFSAMLASALLLTTGSALAQRESYNSQPSRAAKQKAEPAKDAEPEKFPKATRTSPGLQATRAGGKELNELAALVQSKQFPKAIEKANQIASSSGNAYERSFAYELAATAAVESGDKDQAAAYYQKALDGNGLNNNEHYQVMYNLAVTQYQLKRSAAALATLERLMSDTQSESSAYDTLQAAVLADLDRPAEAAALYERELARNPKDGTALMNAAAMYQQAGESAKADELMAKAYAQGLFTDASQYRTLYVGYINDNKAKQAIAVIDDGIAKGIIQPSADLAKAYAVIAQNAYADDDVATAIAMYQRAVPIAADGEPALNLARVYFNEGRLPEARQAAQQALQKGVKNPAAAKKIVGAKDK